MESDDLLAEVRRFDPSLPIERALTPPSGWYRGAGFFELERAAVFATRWTLAARLDELAEPGNYVSGDLMGWPWVVLRDGDGELRGFHNACRHHATALLSGSGRCETIVCPYHGWRYGLDGRLAAAPDMAGVQHFDRETMGLVPLEVRSWRRWLLLRCAHVPSSGAARDDALWRELDRLDAELDALDAGELIFHGRRSYRVACNWKVFVDNYLDGGYHVPQLHRQLSARLDLAGYRTEVLQRTVLQSCPAAAGSGRVGQGALYAWVHPNLCINRYGEVMDVNLIRPLGPELTEVVFEDYRQVGVDKASMAAHLAESEKVQREDMDISGAVQRGLSSPGYDRGRYAPGLEGGEYLFHQLLRSDYGAHLRLFGSEGSR